MKKDLLNILACPMCKGDIDINIIEESGDSIIRGTLCCIKCNINYPIEDGIPNMIPPDWR